jgi:hypothetical protein
VTEIASGLGADAMPSRPRKTVCPSFYDEFGRRADVR